MWPDRIRGNQQVVSGPVLCPRRCKLHWFKSYKYLGVTMLGAIHQSHWALASAGMPILWEEGEDMCGLLSCISIFLSFALNCVI